MLWNLVILNLAMMLISWLIATFNRRVGIVDVTWAFCIAVNVVLSAWLIESAPVSIRIFIGVFSGAWFLRLSWHLLRRYLGETEEDRRYANMRQAMGKSRIA